MFVPVVADISNHVSNHQPRYRRSDGPPRKDGHPTLIEYRSPRKRLLPATHSDRLFNHFIMRSSNSKVQRQLTLASPDIQAYVAALEADNKKLDNLTYYDDPGEGVRIIKLLAVTLIRGFANDCSIENHNASDNFEQLAMLVDNLGDAISHRQRVIAAQNRVA